MPTSHLLLIITFLIFNYALVFASLSNEGNMLSKQNIQTQCIGFTKHAPTGIKIIAPLDPASASINVVESPASCLVQKSAPDDSELSESRAKTTLKSINSRGKRSLIDPAYWWQSGRKHAIKEEQQARTKFSKRQKQQIKALMNQFSLHLIKELRGVNRKIERKEERRYHGNRETKINLHKHSKDLEKKEEIRKHDIHMPKIG